MFKFLKMKIMDIKITKSTALVMLFVITVVIHSVEMFGS